MRVLAFIGCQRFRVLGFKVEGFGFIIMWFITFGFRVLRLRVLGLIGFITRCRVSSVGFASVSTLWLPMQFASLRVRGFVASSELQLQLQLLSIGLMIRLSFGQVDSRLPAVRTVIEVIK